MRDRVTDRSILDTPMGPHDTDAATVGEYLALILVALWREGEGFSGKRPLGNSGWESAVYDACAHAGYVEAVPDHWGGYELRQDQSEHIDRLIEAEIKFALERVAS